MTFGVNYYGNTTELVTSSEDGFHFGLAIIDGISAPGQAPAGQLYILFASRRDPSGRVWKNH